MAVVDCCRFASASELIDETGGPDVIAALEVAHNLLAEIWDEMEITAGLSRPSTRPFARRRLQRKGVAHEG